MLILYLYAATVLRRGNFIRRHQDKETPMRCRAIKIFPRKTPLSLLFSQGHYEPLLFLYRRLAPVIQEKKSPRSNSATVPFSPEMNKETRRPWPSKGPPPPPLFSGSLVHLNSPLSIGPVTSTTGMQAAPPKSRNAAFSSHRSRSFRILELD